MIAKLLAADTKPYVIPEGNSGLSREHKMLVTGKDDIKQLLSIMRQDRGFFEFQELQDRHADTLEAQVKLITVV